MPGSIHVKRARRRVAFAPRSPCADLQNNGRISAKQPTLGKSNKFTSSTLSCDYISADNLRKPDPAPVISIRESSDTASEMATDAPSLNPERTLSTAWPPIRDKLETETSVSQDKTVQQCLPLLQGLDTSLVDCDGNGFPRLDRAKHARFLHRSLQPLPAVAVGFDASRPWMVYWALTALSVLGEDVTPYRERYFDGLATAGSASSWSAG